jgi:hypothetical protein
MHRFITFLGPFVIILCLPFTLLSQVVINEYSVSNLSSFTDNFGQYEDWFELYNTGLSSMDLGGYYLSDDPQDSLKWQFPEGSIIAAGGFVKIWTTGRNLISGNNYHTNFRLSQTKDEPEHIILTNPSGVIVDQVQLAITQKEHARGRTTDGSVAWSIFTSPTPGSSNNNATAYDAYAAAPQMSEIAGFYDDPVSVSITNTEPNSTVHYTSSGSEPTISSPTYSGPIDVSSTQIVIARTFSNNPSVLPSLLTFNTYFINESHSLGVMSTSADQLDNLLNGNQSLRPFGTFEYFNAEGERTNIGYGEFNEHGQDSWVHDQRSIDYISRDECGYNYAIREQLVPFTDRDEYQRIILRAAGDDNYPGIDTSALLRDYFIQNTATKGGLHLDCRKGQKGVLYVNGQYWGVYGFREKVNDHDYTGYYYDQGKYDIYYLMLWGGSWAEYGGQAAWDDWNDLHNFIKFNDMSNQENYEYVKTRLDYTSLVDYILINSYVVCSDWINWNVGWWRGTNPEGGHQKWGYVLWDEDATFNHYINYTGVPGTTPYVPPCYPEGLTSDPEEHIVMLNHLLDNEEFATYYVSRYVDLYNTVFRPENMIAYLDSIEAEMAPEMPQHVARWGGSLQQWQNNVQKIRNFINTRHSYLPSGFNNCYDLTGPYEFNVAIDPPGAGIVRVNTVMVENSGWGGYYFGNIDTELEAIEISPNYQFDHWELYNHTPEPSDTAHIVTINLTTGDYMTAVFEPVLFADSLVINEIMYNADTLFDTKDWVEFYNPHDYALNIAGWQFRDEDDTHVFEFPENTVLEPYGYLVLCRDTAEFTSFYPNVTNYIGEMDFGLNSAGELIRVFNADGILVDSVHYDNNDPWPTEPDGEGPTLELKFWAYDNALPESWIASAEYGTPGEMNGYMVGRDTPKSNAAELSYTIYPSPADDKAMLQITSGQKVENAVLTIHNGFGKMIFSQNGINNHRIQLNVQTWPAGLYISTLQIPEANISQTRKFMVR